MTLAIQPQQNPSGRRRKAFLSLVRESRNSPEMNNLPRTTDLVSVVINVLNGSRTISMAIESALNQIDVNLEVIVWDNGSTDGNR